VVENRSSFIFNSEMKQFLIKTILFLSVSSLLFFSTKFMLKQYKPRNFNDYMAAIIDKHTRVKNINSPKIIISGGSNLAFGVESKMLEEEFKMPVVNMALHAGLGVNFILEQLKQTIKQDDIVLISFEHFMSLDGKYDLKKFTGEIFNESKKFYSINPLEEIKIEIENTRNDIKNFIQKGGIQTSSNNDVVSVYSRKAFNELGDVVAHLSLPIPQEITGRKIFTYEYWGGIKELNNFHEYARKRNVQVYYLYPTYPNSEFNKNKRAIELLSEDLNKDLNIKIINKPTDFVYDDSDFFDTVYHLNKSGREKRTKQLINIIKENCILTLK
jgi:hypothetical protein